MLRDPVVCRDGHTMCKVCLDKATSGSFPACPVDRSYLGTSGPVRNLALQALIMGFKIKCPNGSRCKWIGKLEGLSNHRNQCEMEMLGCTNAQCAALVYRYEMGSHQDQCPHKSEPCIHCQMNVKVAEMEMHLKTCAKVKISCPNNCGENIFRYIIFKI